MRNALLVALAFLPGIAPQAAPQQVAPGPERFTMRTVASGLEAPWQMRVGPDNRIWVTERVGRRISRIDPATGARTTAVTISDALQQHAQDGVLGLALHPDLLAARNMDFVYVSMIYDADSGPGITPRMAVRRYRFDTAREQLVDPLDLLRDLPAGGDHVSGRPVFGRDNALYLTIGDQGFNQFSFTCQPIRSQELPAAVDLAARNHDRYQGKVLRLALDGSIPDDNPVLNGVRSHVFSYGHRNAQGLASGRDGRLFVSEHGPSVDDEVNQLRPGGNYGWPHVAGYRDDRAYVYANWSEASVPCASLKYDATVAPPSVPQRKESEWSHPDFVPPVRSFFTVNDGYRFDVAGNATIAPSGIDVYDVPSGGIPGWTSSVLVTSLLRGTIYRVPLAASGGAAAGETTAHFPLKARYRDVLVSPDGLTIYVASDTSSQEHPGSLLAFTYQSGSATRR